MTASTINSTAWMSQNFKGEFKLLDLHLLRSKSLLTPHFFPLPNKHVKFCFEVHHIVRDVSCPQSSDGHKFILIKLKLMASSVCGLSPRMRIKLDVSLNFLDDTTLYTYKLPPLLTIDQINSLVFEDLIITYRSDYSIMSKLVNENSFKIVCQVAFSNYRNPLNYYKDLSSFVHLENFLTSFKSVQYAGDFSDITIIIGENSFPAHKAVLAAHSSVFRNMLAHDFKESLTNTITITDASPDIFEHFLRYMYSGEIGDESWPVVKELYILADKYDISSLKRLMCDMINSQISIENVCDVLCLSFNYDDKAIKKEAVGFASLHIKELISTKEWKDLIAKHPLAGYEAAINYIL